MIVMTSLAIALSIAALVLSGLRSPQLRPVPVRRPARRR